jgi:hypothetical protein
MGQSASTNIKPPTAKGKLARVRNLSDKDLQELCELITADEVKIFAKTLKRSDSVKGFYTEEQDSIETALAKRLLEVSKPLSQIRFKLVPSKMKENLFWKAVFGILEESAISLEGKAQLFQEDGELAIKKPVENGETKANRPKDSSRSKLHRSQTATVTVVEELKIILEHREREITVLMQKLEKANKEIHRLSNISRSTPALPPAATGPQHKGEWIMEKDSLDFLEYPEELKENMRNEKKKRLEEVHNQMRFILDSDDIEDTFGEWSCCKSKSYNSVCTKR